ncbi:MAG: SlyX family protein [Xanthomonadales bacterium]|nr:SlyX family protein [Xanthomonadales bacterium]
MDPDSRLVDIETRIAFQEEAMRQLTDALARQQQDLERLARLCQALQARLDAGAALPDPVSPEDERPPHY